MSESEEKKKRKSRSCWFPWNPSSGSLLAVVISLLEAAETLRASAASRVADDGSGGARWAFEDAESGFVDVVAVTGPVSALAC